MRAATVYSHAGIAPIFWSAAERLRSWQRWGTAALFGALLTLAFAPFGWWLCVVPAFGVLLVLLDSCRCGREAFACGWWFGFGHFVSSLHWISRSLLVEPDKFAWLIPFAVSLIPAVLACYTGLAGWLYVKLAARLGGNWRRVLLFSLCWAVAEWLRGHMPVFAFPWNLLGTIWTASDAMLQSASLVGVYGLSLLTAMLAAVPVLAVMRDGQARRHLCWAIMLLAALYGWGSWRLAHADCSYVEGVKLRLVQGNIPQNHGWDPLSLREMVDKHIMLSRSGDSLEGITHVIWSESSLPYAMTPFTPPLAELTPAIPEHGLLITGGIRLDERRRPYNSIMALGEGGAWNAVYDKRRLVPFGEFVPFRSWLPLQKITHGLADFTPGSGDPIVHLNGLPPLRPLICYEAIFPDAILPQGETADWLLNVTNDGWFGDSAGPYQHLAMARLRAAELGIPLMRVANTGVSAVVNAYGQVLQSLPLGHAGVIDSKLPSKLTRITIYNRYRMLTALLLIVFTYSLAFLSSKVWAPLKTQT